MESWDGLERIESNHYFYTHWKVQPETRAYFELLRRALMFARCGAAAAKRGCWQIAHLSTFRPSGPAGRTYDASVNLPDDTMHYCNTSLWNNALLQYFSMKQCTIAILRYETMHYCNTSTTRCTIAILLWHDALLRSLRSCQSSGTFYKTIHSLKSCRSTSKTRRCGSVVTSPHFADPTPLTTPT